MDGLDDYFEYALDLPEPDRQRLLTELRTTDPALAAGLTKMLAEALKNPDFACHGMPLAAAPTEPAAVLALWLTVGDVAAAVRWYQDVFRCRLVRQDTEFAVVAFQNLELHLRAGDGPPGIAVMLPDAQRLGGLTRQEDGSRRLQLVDPSGNVFWVTDRDGRSA